MKAQHQDTFCAWPISTIFSLKTSARRTIDLLLANGGKLASATVELQLEIHLIADFQAVDHGRSDAAHDLHAGAGTEEYGVRRTEGVAQAEFSEPQTMY